MKLAIRTTAEAMAQFIHGRKVYRLDAEGRRLRSYLWRQWQNGPNRFKKLRQRGLPKFHAAVAAGSPTGFWRMSGHPAHVIDLGDPLKDAWPRLAGE